MERKLEPTDIDCYVVERVVEEGNYQRYGKVKATYNGMEIDPMLDLVNHSPDGFEYGYGGSGPAQLAFSILFHYFYYIAGMQKQDAFQKAYALHQQFKWDVIAKKTDDFTIPVVLIRYYVEAYVTNKEGSK